MGQYYTIINLTKKEYITPHDLTDGAKLLELNVTAMALCVLCANSNGRGGGDLNIPYGEVNYSTEPETYTPAGQDAKLRIEAVAGRWAGDRIVVQGDYAEKGDKAFVTAKRLKGFRCINAEVRNALSVDKYFAEKFAEDDKICASWGR